MHVGAVCCTNKLHTALFFHNWKNFYVFDVFPAAVGELQQRSDDAAEAVQESDPPAFRTRNVDQISNVRAPDAAPLQSTPLSGL